MIFKSDIEKLVKVKKVSNFKNHFAEYISNEKNKEYSGEIKEDNIILWQSQTVGYFIVFDISFNPNKTIKNIVIKNNNFHSLIKKIVPVFFLILVYVIIFSDNVRFAITISFVITIFFCLGYLILNAITKFQKELQIEVLRKDLLKIELKNNPDLIASIKLEVKEINEWTFSKIMLRIILYPFCIFIIGFSIYSLFTELKMLRHAVFGIVISLTYLISDILILFKKENIKPNSFINYIENLLK